MSKLKNITDTWKETVIYLIKRKTITFFIFITVFVLLTIFALRLNITCESKDGEFNYSIEMNDLDDKIPKRK